MVKTGLARTTINARVNKAKAFFRWCVGEEAVSPTVWHGLLAVRALRAGRTDAIEPDPVIPAPIEHVNKVKARVRRQVAALIDLQLLTGARPGELVGLRPIDLDTTGEIWLHTPAHHKTAHLQKRRTIYFGPKAQEILRQFLQRPVTACMFSPAEAMREFNQARHDDRRTPQSCGNNIGANRVRTPMKQPGDHYTVQSYGQAIRNACEALEIPVWSPNQLRHNAATRIRREHGPEAAQIILGHSHIQTTEIYAETAREKALEVIQATG